MPRSHAHARHPTWHPAERGLRVYLSKALLAPTARERRRMSSRQRLGNERPFVLVHHPGARVRIGRCGRNETDRAYSRDCIRTILQGIQGVGSCKQIMRLRRTTPRGYPRNPPILGLILKIGACRTVNPQVRGSSPLRGARYQALGSDRPSHIDPNFGRCQKFRRFSVFLAEQALSLRCPKAPPPAVV